MKAAIQALGYSEDTEVLILQYVVCSGMVNGENVPARREFITMEDLLMK